MSAEMLNRRDHPAPDGQRFACDIVGGDGGWPGFGGNESFRG